MPNNDSDPIVAIATAPGRGGIGVVRLSFGRAGEAAADHAMHALCGQLLARVTRAMCRSSTATARRSTAASRCTFPRRTPTPANTCSSCRDTAARSCCNWCCSGAIDAGREFGLRLAEPGEFTRRAFLNDKLDLAQAEAVADLIEASTEAAARSAGRSLDGAFSREIHALVEDVITLRMLVEATLDFPEEEIDFLEAADARGKLARIRERLVQGARRRAPGRVAARGFVGGARGTAERRASRRC